MAVNIFEELVRVALNAQGYLTFENAAYKRHANAKSVVGLDNPPMTPSDIDLIAFSPKRNGPDRILAVNCKGGQEPLILPRDIERILKSSQQSVAGAPAEKGFRELANDDWARAFRGCVGGLLDETDFTHVTVVRTIEGDRSLWTANEAFKKRLKRPLDLWSLDDVVRKLREDAGRMHKSNSMIKLVDLLYRTA